MVAERLGRVTESAGNDGLFISFTSSVLGLLSRFLTLCGEFSHCLSSARIPTVSSKADRN